MAHLGGSVSEFLVRSQASSWPELAISRLGWGQRGHFQSHLCGRWQEASVPCHVGLSKLLLTIKPLAS